MKLIANISEENLEAIANLQSNKDFRILLDLLRSRRNKLALACLQRDVNTDEGRKEIQEMQIESRVITNLVEMCKEAVEKVESREKAKSTKK